MQLIRIFESILGHWRQKKNKYATVNFNKIIKIV